MILSMIDIVSAGVKSINVACPHNGTYDLCIFAIFLETGFVDIIPLCYKLSQWIATTHQSAEWSSSSESHTCLRRGTVRGSLPAVCSGRTQGRATRQFRVS